MADRIQTAKGWLDIRTLKPGEKIKENGVYALTMEQYHGDCTEGPSISSSGLRTIQAYSPLHYWNTSYMNPDRDEDALEELEQKEAIRIGRAVHTLILEPKTFRGLFKIRPSEWKDWRTNASQEWKEAQIAQGVTVLTEDEMTRVATMAGRLMEHELFTNGVLDGHIELSMVWKDERTGVWLKSRPDALPRGTNVVADVKCLRDVRDEPLQRAIFDSGYDVQLAMVGVGRRVLLGLETEEHLLICIESKRPHAIRAAPIPENEIHDSLLILRQSINTFAKCVKENVWPGFEANDSAYVSRTPWARQKLEQEIKYGLLPDRF